MAELDREDLHREMTAWRHELHAHPEFGFEEKRTSPSSRKSCVNSG